MMVFRALNRRIFVHYEYLYGRFVRFKIAGYARARLKSIQYYERAEN